MRACGEKETCVCVGIDPVYERLPAELLDNTRRRSARYRVDAIVRFCQTVMEVVAPHVPCVKLQSACFERYWWPGVEAYHRLIDHGRRLGLMVIADAKRGDIGISADHYAHGFLAPVDYDDLDDLLGPDALTVHAYLGVDALEPMLETSRQASRGLFALVRTSNPGGDVLQGLSLEEGGTVADATARMIAEAGATSDRLGRSGYSLLGAVVGATKPQDAVRLRGLMPEQIFLVPGFGAQGGKADDVRACFNPDGRGALVTASRSILYAYQKDDTVSWPAAIEKATIHMKLEIAEVSRPRGD